MAKIRKEFTRLVVDARKTAGLTQEEAADFIGCAVTTLQKYETDDIRIHDDTAASMALVYRDPRIKKWYCENECAIGCQERRCEWDKPADALLLDIAMVDKDDLTILVRTLRRIMADGIIDDTEIDDCDCSIDQLASLEKTFGELRLRLQKMRASSGH